jgi:hypothetical protein
MAVSGLLFFFVGFGLVNQPNSQCRDISGTNCDWHKTRHAHACNEFFWLEPRNAGKPSLPSLMSVMSPETNHIECIGNDCLALSTALFPLHVFFGFWLGFIFSGIGCQLGQAFHEGFIGLSGFTVGVD